MIKRENLGFLLIVVGIIVFLVFTLFGNFVHFPGKFDPESLSKYGGFIGGTVGSIFTLAGFLIIYESFRLQKRQLFENSFFNLFSQFNDFRFNQIGLIYVENETERYLQGHSFFQEVFEKELGLSSYKSTTTIEKVDLVYKMHRSHLGRFLGHVNIIVYYLESNSEISIKERDFYFSYLLSQLSEQEKFLIYHFEYHEDNKNFSYLPRIFNHEVTDFRKYFK